MAIIRSKIARQLLADGGVSLDDAKMMAPEGEFLAYINPKEAGILRSMGGSGKMTPMGIPSFTEDEEDQAAMNAPDYSSQDLEEQAAIDAGEPTAQMSTRSRDLQGFGPGTDISDLQAPSFFQNVGTGISNLIGQGRRGENILNFLNRSTATTMRGRLGLGKPGDINYVLDLLQNPDDRIYGLSNKEREIGEKLIDAGIKNEADIRGMTQTQFDELFPGPNTGGGGDGDNEPIKRLRAPITEKKEEKPKDEFADILKFYGARFARGGDVDYADQDLEEQAAIDAGEATAQMTTQERDEQGYGGGSADDLPTQPQTGPTVYGGGPTTSVSGFGLLGRPTPTISKATQDKITRDILTEEDDITFGLDTLKQGAFNVGKAISAEGSLYDKALTGPYGAGAVQREQSLRDRFGIGKADGGEVRQNYGLGSIVKKATRAVKKVAKSPLGKAAIFAGLGAYGLGAGPFASGKFGAGFLKGPLAKKLFLKEGAKEFALGNLNPFSAITAASLLAGAFSKQDEEDEKLPTVAQSDPEFQKFLEFYGGPRRFAESGGDINEAPMGGMMASAPSSFAELNMLSIELFGRPYDKLNESEQEILIEYFSRKSPKPEGIPEPRAQAAEGGMMDLGGNEMDLRGGGFVPLGAKEKADDVPARLSKNEFVFTADAVRAAGGGSVDRGADIMYKTMKNLENKVA